MVVYGDFNANEIPLGVFRGNKMGMKLSVWQ